jgi:hypothetical protein
MEESDIPSCEECGLLLYRVCDRTGSVIITDRFFCDEGKENEIGGETEKSS